MNWVLLPLLDRSRFISLAMVPIRF